jgi:hypothetical protein
MSWNGRTEVNETRFGQVDPVGAVGTVARGQAHRGCLPRQGVPRQDEEVCAQHRSPGVRLERLEAAQRISPGPHPYCRSSRVKGH